MERFKNIKNPIMLKISDGKITIPSVDDDLKANLSKGVFFAGETHYGIIVFSDKRSEYGETYETASSIVGLKVDEDKILIYEDGTNGPWIFDLEGSLIKSSKLSSDDYDEYVVNGELRKKSKSGVKIVIGNDITNVSSSYIEYSGEKFSLMKGIVFGSEIYGFTVDIKDEDENRVIEYPTEGVLYGIQASDLSKILVYESDKSIPWSFTFDGKLMSEADFAKTLYSEQIAYCKRHGLTIDELEMELGIDGSHYQPTLK